MPKIRISCKKPKKVHLLIYDSVGVENLKSSLGSEIKWGVIEVRKVEINLHPFVLVHYFVVFICWLNLKVRNKVGIDLRTTLELALIRSRQPKIVITNIDNSRRFSALSRTYNKARFIAVQNAFRTDEVNDIARYMRVTNFFCFGAETIDRYIEAGCGIDNYMVLGSLRNGLYRRAYPKKPKKNYDLCFVSQFKPARFEESMPELKTTSLRLLDYSERYCLDNGKTLVIAGNAKDKRLPYEYKYYLETLNDRETRFVPNDNHSYSSYRTIDESEVTVVINSTIGYESLARGGKVLFCNFSSDSYYDVPGRYRDGVWSLRGEDISYEQFSQRLNKLFEMPLNVWEGLVGEMAEYFVHEDDKQLQQDVLAEHLKKFLDES